MNDLGFYGDSTMHKGEFISCTDIDNILEIAEKYMTKGIIDCYTSFENKKLTDNAEEALKILTVSSFIYLNEQLNSIEVDNIHCYDEVIKNTCYEELDNAVSFYTAILNLNQIDADIQEDYLYSGSNLVDLDKRFEAFKLKLSLMKEHSVHPYKGDLINFVKLKYIYSVLE